MVICEQTMKNILVSSDIMDDDPWVPIAETESLATVLTHFSRKQNIHRVPVIPSDPGDPEENKNNSVNTEKINPVNTEISSIPVKFNNSAGNTELSGGSAGKNKYITGLLTQSRVVQYLMEHYKDLPMKIRKKTIQEWHSVQNTNYRKAVETVIYTQCTFLAYRLLMTKGISGVGVIDDSGRLVGSLSGTDFIRRVYPNDFEKTVNELYKPVGLYMMSGEKVRVENFTCRMSDTVDDLLRKFTDFKLHRLFIVDKDGKPLSVISLCDILTLFQVE